MADPAVARDRQVVGALQAARERRCKDMRAAQISLKAHTPQEAVVARAALEVPQAGM
jgi:hypothetical protein